MKKKRILSLLACGVMAAGATIGLAACKKDDNTITVWAPQNQQTLVKSLVDDFLKENPDFGLNVNFGVCGEDQAFATVSKDVQASADIYGFANDQLMNLRKAGGLSPLSDKAVDVIKQNNDLKSVDAGKITEGGVDKYYGYPYAADNGFFMYYDKSVVTDESAATLEGVLNSCAKQHKYFVMQLAAEGGWYVGSFFYAAGGEYKIKWNGSTLESAGVNFDEMAVDVNGDVSTEYTIGQIGGNAVIDLVNDTQVFKSGDDSVIQQLLTSKQLGAAISGTWNAALFQEKLGSNYAATKLPTYKGIDGRNYQMKPFIGYKLYAVNPYSNHAAESHRLAAYLASETAQTKRFEALGIGPSNLNVQNTEAVKSNVALQALFSQRDFAVVQESLPDSYWSTFKAFAADVCNGAINKGNLSDSLQAVVDGLNI
ncbi:MAG: extracellular solute-binding protein [Clostridia bacterium]|nr:extracellular solute-binding protein [Clostridia bacterium]